MDRRVLELIPAQPADAAQIIQEIAARESLRDVLFTAVKHRESEVQLRQALDLILEKQDPKHRAALVYKLVDFCLWRGEYDRAIEVAIHMSRSYERRWTDRDSKEFEEKVRRMIREVNVIVDRSRLMEVKFL